jgi:hypothetical protein
MEKTEDENGTASIEFMDALDDEPADVETAEIFDSEASNSVNNLELSAAAIPVPRISLDLERHPDRNFLFSAKPFRRALTRFHADTSSWRLWTAHKLEAVWFHIMIIALTFLDLIFIVSELIIEVLAQHASCQLVLDHREPKAEIILSPQVETALDVLFYMSLSIICFFGLELLIKLLVYGPKHFRHPFEFFDAVIIITSITLDLIYRGQEEGIAIEVIIVLRFWRLIRIMDSVAGEVRQSAEIQLRKFAKKKRVDEARIKELEEEVEKLKGGQQQRVGVGTDGERTDGLSLAG